MLKEAEPVVAQLAEKKNYAVGMLVVADFYRLLNEFAASKDSRLKELRAWKKVAAGRGNFASRAFAELYRAGESSAVYEASPNDPEAKIAQAFVLAQDVNRQDEARQILNDYRDAFESWYMRLKLLELSVLLRDDGAAIELCQRWRESAHLRKLDEFDPFRQELVHALADQRLDSLEVQNDWQRFLKQYFVALQLYAGGHVPEAKQRLEYCINHPSLNVADHWARAFYERWTD